MKYLIDINGCIIKQDEETFSELQKKFIPIFKRF